MARGKIPIKKIENATNRQVTYSKRRTGLFKKAHELSVLCDAKVSIIMVSSTRKLHEFITEPLSQKQFYDQYQKAKPCDLWSSHYQVMQEQLRKLREVNRNLRNEISHRKGESLNGLSHEELYVLEQKMQEAVDITRTQKMKTIVAAIEKSKKKVRNGEQVQRNLLQEFELIKEEDPHYGLVDNGGDYETVFGCSNAYPGLLALRLQSNHYNFHGGAGSDLTFA
ncbi:floral homeotic protein DEFICIENS-like [Apium graveolens]|uniref:floral homeotic protein DEFICIENS-like n=1 Tax=Apium graveolens TaxID=4045 RepID=UPI003D7A3105